MDQGRAGGMDFVLSLCDQSQHCPKCRGHAPVVIARRPISGPGQAVAELDSGKIGTKNGISGSRRDEDGGEK